MKKVRVVFLTGTRADYGKLKPLMRICDSDEEIESSIYVTGMHLLPEYGFTCKDIFADGYRDIYIPEGFASSDEMDENLAYTVLSFSAYIRKVKPDLIVVHGDRVEPLAGAIVGVLNNIKVAHIEGGEITGTADEFMRHAISKLSSLHFVANDESKYRLIQLGEREDSIYVTGSPDIDIMLSESLPTITTAKKTYGVDFDKYAIFIYHPVTTSTNLQYEIQQVISAIIDSGVNYIAIYPNNDHGAEVIQSALSHLKDSSRFRLFKSIPFESFLVFLKNSEFIIGNSSAGIREACIYGIPAIDIGMRQNKRYIPGQLKNIQHTEENKQSILRCISEITSYRYASRYFGDGESAQRFLDAIKAYSVLNTNLQKTFVELDVTSEAIKNYINEVCF